MKRVKLFMPFALPIAFAPAFSALLWSEGGHFKAEIQRNTRFISAFLVVFYRPVLPFRQSVLPDYKN